jgi:hypothetical protein
MIGLSIDGAIKALTAARERLGDDAPLHMADQLTVYSFPIGDGCLYVCDVSDEDPDMRTYWELLAAQQTK